MYKDVVPGDLMVMYKDVVPGDLLVMYKDVVPGDLLVMYKDAAMTSGCTPLIGRIIGEY